ncbi:hypothetical protein LDENG_00168300, partial [Lucifuga dentata]
QKAQEVTFWLVQAYDELLEGWNSTEGESYSERYHVFQTFLVSFNEQRRPIMPLLTAMRRTSKLSEAQRALREAWDALTEKLREFKMELDMTLPAPLDTVARWLLRTEGTLAEEEGDPQDHGRAADEAREKQELLKVCLEEMPQQVKVFHAFQNVDEYGNMMIPTDKIEEMKRRFTSVRVTAKYHSIKLEYQKHRHTVLDLLGQIRIKLRVWRRPYISQEAVRVLLQEWHELVNKEDLPSLLEAALHKLKQVSEKYISKSALAADCSHVSRQVKELEEGTAAVLQEVTETKSTMSRVLSAWDSYSDCLSSLQAWLEQGSATHTHGAEVTSDSMAEWSSRQAHLNQVGNFLIEATDPRSSRSLADELRRLNMHWAEFVKRTTFDGAAESSADVQIKPQDLQALIREATMILKEPVEAMAAPLRTYRKRIQFVMRKIKEVDLDALAPSSECPAEKLHKMKLAIPEVMQTLFEAEQLCTELQHSVLGLDGRLAELLHWETEARELYQLMRAAERQPQQGQNPQTRVLISRGLQLEGQVVTEEQDLQVMVMTSQKNSPIQYLHASAMQDRVRAAVAQSQEAVGMLSSLGARRDRSRSPPEGPPPSKLFIPTDEESEYQTPLDAGQITQQPQPQVSHQYQEPTLPKIVVQEYTEEKMSSSPLPYTYTQALMQTRPQSPPEDQDKAQPVTVAQKQPQIQDQAFIQQQEQIQIEKQQQQEQQELQQQKQEELTVKQEQQQQHQEQEQQVMQQQQVEQHQFEHQQHVVTHGHTEVQETPETQNQPSPQQPAERKQQPLSSKELQSRKAKARKNRPWLQEQVPEEVKTPEQVSSPEQAQSPQPDKEAVVSVQVVPQHTGTPMPQQQHQKPEKQQHQHQKQQQEQIQHHQKQQEPQQKQPEESRPPLTYAQPHLGSKVKSQVIIMSEPQQTGQTESQLQTTASSELPSVVQVQSTTHFLHSLETPAHPQTHSPVNTQSFNQTWPQQQLQPQNQALPQPQTSAQVRSQSPMQPRGQLQGKGHDQATAQVQTWAQVRSPSPMQTQAQAQLQAQIQPPMPSHIQLRSHPQSWAPVRPPSPKPPQPPPQTRPQTHPQPVTEPQPHAQPMAQPQIYAQPIVQSQTHVQPMAQSQDQPMLQHQIQGQPLVQPQGHSQPVTQYHAHAQSVVQDPGQVSQGHMAWTHVRDSSAIPVQHPQATDQPPLYPQDYYQEQSLSHQWTHKQEGQSQAVSQQRGMAFPQVCPHPFVQAHQAQAFPTVQALQQWVSAGHHQGPPGYPHMGTLYPQQNQPWAQTQAQLRPQQQQQQQQPQMRPYNLAQQGQVQQQSWIQAPPQIQPQPHPQIQPQQYLQAQHQPQSQPHIDAQAASPSQLPHQAYPQLSPQPPRQTQLEDQSKTQIQSQLPVQTKVQVQIQQDQPKVPLQQAPIQPKPHQSSPQSIIQSPTPPKTESAPHCKPQAHPPPPPQPVAQPPNQPKAELAPQPKPPAQYEAQSPVQSKAQPLPQLKPQAHLPLKPESQAQAPQSKATQPKLQALSPPQPKVQSVQQSVTHSQPLPQSIPPSHSPAQPKPQQPPPSLLSQPEQPDLCIIKPPVLAQAPLQAYTEAYVKAQALARNGFEDAKHCLQEHILEAINVFKDKHISAEQVSIKEETLKTLDPELLEEFLRAAEGMEAFCTPSQLRDLEFFTQSVRTQWEDVRAEISRFLQQLQFEVTWRNFNTAALQCEMQINSRLANQEQACFSVDGSLAQAGQQLEALKELCDTLSPEDAHRLAQAQLRECEKRLAAIQHQFSGDQDIPDSRISVDHGHDLSAQKESTKPPDKVSYEVSQVTVKTSTLEKREVEKQDSVEEDLTKKESLEKYENSKRTLQAQLAKNEQSIQDAPSDSASLKGLHTRLQEIQFLRQETECLWSDYRSQCSQLSKGRDLEQERAELQEQWRSQQLSLQRRGSSLGAALRQIDSTENHMVDFTDRLDRYLRQPKDIMAFTLANTNILRDIKELDDNIQSELDQLSRLDSESSDLDPRDCFPLSREVETHRTSLDQLRQQVRKSEAAARALDRFLMSLRTVDEDISGVQGAPCSDAGVLQDCRSKLALIRQSIDSLKEKAPQLDLLLQGARLTVTRDGAPASCLDMVAALVRRLEEADSRLASQQQSMQKEMKSRSLGLRKRTLLGELRKLQETAEAQGLKESTMPAVQQRLRALSDLESQVQAQHSELQSLRELQQKEGGGENLLQELETQWEETQRAVTDRKDQCSILMELLKKFQSCHNQLNNTLQTAEHTIGDQASYMGKENLQRLIAKVHDIKENLGGLGEQMEELRGISRQLQSHLKKIPDCSDAPFEAEADTLMDSWLDVTEKTDAYMDNLQVGLELWEKQLMLGGEVDSWAGAKLALFSESHPFHSEQQVLAMKDEIHANEENIEHFHKKSAEIQEMLQSQEAPLELQVMETQLRKRMQQVKELFTDCADVFEELVAVKKHLVENIEDCHAAIEKIQTSLSEVSAADPEASAQIQDVCEDLEAQEEQAEAVLKEVGLISSVASPQVMEALSADYSRLRAAIAQTKDLIQLKRKEKEKGFLTVIKDESESFEEWFQDLQLSVNECFENPESRTDVEVSLQKLAGFLASKEGERRLDRLRDQLEHGDEQIPPQQLAELGERLKEQQQEVATFRAHCHNRQKQMETFLSTLNSLQEQHNSFLDWLQTKEKESVQSDHAKRLLKDLQDESGRAEGLSELLALVRRHGVRADNLLKDGDNLIQRYRKLQTRLQTQAEAQSALQGEFVMFNTQAESTRTWIGDLLQTLNCCDAQPEETKHTAEMILSSKPEGDAKVNNLRRRGQSLLEHEDTEESRRREVQQSIRDTEEQWQNVLQAAEDAHSKAETRACLDKEMDEFKTQNENVQFWIREQNLNLQAVGGLEERLEIVRAVLASTPEGDSKVKDLRTQSQNLSEHRDLDESRRGEVQQTVKDREDEWRKVLQAAEEALNKAETQAALERDCDVFKTQNESIQSWIRDQRQTLVSLGGQMPFEERSQAVQAFLTLKPDGESRVQDLRRRGLSLCEREELEELRKQEVQQLLTDTEQQWRTVLQTARQVELRSLLDDFDSQNKTTQSWIRDIQQQLQSAGVHTPPELRLHTAKTILRSKPEGDCKVNNLRRRGQSLCDRQEVEESRKEEVQHKVKDTEEQWRRVLQAANQLEEAAEAQMAQQTERKMSELGEFDTHSQGAGIWLTDLQQRLDSVDSNSKAEDRLSAAQVSSCCRDNKGILIG